MKYSLENPDPNCPTHHGCACVMGEIERLKALVEQGEKFDRWVRNGWGNDGQIRRERKGDPAEWPDESPYEPGEISAYDFLREKVASYERFIQESGELASAEMARLRARISELEADLEAGRAAADASAEPVG